MPKFLIQTHKFSGYYKNPFKQDGKGIKFTPWTTIRATDDQRQAELLWQEFNATRQQGILERFRVVYKGKVVVSDRGAVYAEVVNGNDKYTHMVKTLEGYEI